MKSLKKCCSNRKKADVISFKKYAANTNIITSKCCMCSLEFTTKNKKNNVCDTCKDGIKLFINTEENKAMIATWSGY